MKYILILLILWNLSVFFLMAHDKKQAVANRRRVRERTLLLCAFFMGAAGEVLGALIFRHKTRKAKFRILLPLFLACNTAVILFFLKTAAF